MNAIVLLMFKETFKNYLHRCWLIASGKYKMIEESRKWMVCCGLLRSMMLQPMEDFLGLDA